MPRPGLVRHRFAAVSLSLVLLVEAGAVAPPPAFAAPAPPNAPTIGADPPPAVDPPLPGQPESPTELTDERTATTRTFDNHDGTFTTELSPEPLFYQPPGSVAWEPIDLTFVTGRTPDEVAVADRSPVVVALSDTTDAGGFLRLQANTHTVAFSLVSSEQPVADVGPVTDGPRADYVDIQPGVDLRVFARADGAKSFLSLRDSSTPTSFTFVVDAPGLRLEEQRDGSLAFVDGRGVVVARMPSPYAVDSSVSPERGGGAFSDAVSLSVGTVDGQPAVTISVDPEYLAAATYPVFVDPTVDFLTGSQTYGDAFVSQAYPTQNFADYQRPDPPYYHEHWLGMDPSNSNNVNEVYLKFDLSSIANATIESAVLKVLPYHQYYDAPTATNTWVNKVSATWTETGLTWNNRPASTSLTSQGLVEGSYSSFSVTSTVQAWVDGSSANHGFKLHENGNGATYWKRLISAENGGNVPKLTVTYHQPVATVVNPANWSGSRTLNWTYTDGSGHPQSHYQVQVSTVSNFASILSDSGVLAGATTNWTIPGGVTLTEGTYYYWRVKVKDGTGWSTWAMTYFIWESIAPSGTVSLNGGALTTDTSTVQVTLTGLDASTTNVYANDGRSLSALATPCGSTTCGSWSAYTLGTDRAQGAVTALANQGASPLWHSLTVDAAASNRPALAMDVMRSSLNTIYLGAVGDGNDGYRFELRSAGGTSLTTLGYTATSTPNSWTNLAVNYEFTPNIWYRLVLTATGSSGATYALWWYPRSDPQPSTPTQLITGVYLPSPRLHVFQQASAAAPARLWIDDVKVTHTGVSAPFGSGVTGVRFSTDGGSNWGAWQGYRDLATYALPAGSGSRTVSAQFRDGAGNVSSTVSDSITVALGNLGRQAQHRFETWDLGADDELAVNIANGNLVVGHPLVTLPYRGGSLPLTLTYNSQDAANVGLGLGWRLDIQRRLTINGDNTVTFTDGDGAQHTFTNPVVNGSVTTYTRPPALYATLVKDTSQGVELTLTHRDQSRDKFDISGSSGLLVRAEDRHGNGLDVAYSGGTANIATVTDPAGRVVDFAWDTAPTPDRLTSITDWAWIDGSGVVQTTATGSRRTYRFFYDGSGNLIGWSDPLNTTGSCPTGGSHLTCLGYSSGLLAAVSKTQTYTTFSGGLSTATRTITTTVTYAGSRVATVRDAEQEALGGPSTSFSADFADRVVVRRPTTTTTHGLVAPADPYARIGSVWRQFDPLTEIQQATTWDSTFPIEPASVSDNATALQGAPARTVTSTYMPGSLGLLLKLVEPLTASPATNRWTEYVYNANNDVTQRTVSQDGSGTLRTITRYCYEATCATSGVGPDLLKQVENWADGLNGTNDTDVITEYQYDAFGQRIRVTRHNRDAAGAVLDDRVDGFSYDGNGYLTAEIINYVNGTVTSPGDDITPNVTSQARTDLTTAYTHDTAGNQVSAADPRRAIEGAKGTSLSADDFITRWTYDALNQRLSDRTPTTPGIAATQKTSTSVFDELGLARSTTDFGGLVTASAFDRAGRAIATYQDPSGESARQVAAASFDPDGRVLTAKNERQVNDSALGSTASAYDPLGRLASVTESSGGANPATSASGHDGLDRRTAYEVGVGEPASLLTTYLYDLGERIGETNDGFACKRNAFDYRDLATSTIEGLTPGSPCTGSGLRTITHTLDGLGRLTRSQVTAGQGLNDRTVDDVYDAVGNRRSSSTTQGGVVTSTTSTVNLLDQVIAEVRSGGTWAKTTYDPAGNPADRCLWAADPGANACLPAGSTFPNPQPTAVTSTASDARNQRISLTDGGTNATTTYDPDHNYQVEAMYLPTGGTKEHQTLYGYDPDRHRLVSVTHQLCALVEHPCSGPNVLQATGSDAYEYDTADSRTRVTEANGAGSLDRYYCYDAHDRLIATRSASGCSTGLLEAYTYDDAGNRPTAGAVSFTYSPTGVLTGCSPSCGTLASDAAGRLTRWNGWFFEYDAAGRLIWACQAAATCSGGLYNEVAYLYDGEGHRTQLRTYAAGTASPVATTDFRYQGDALVEERLTDATHAGTVVWSYLVDESGAIVTATRSFGGSQAAYDGTYLVTWSGHGDALGLWKIEATGALTLANAYTYSTWGAPTTSTHNGYPDLGFRFLYVGQHDVQWDNSYGLGLLYMHARHYAPSLGRFLQPDPVAAEENAWAYAANSPVSKVDPEGTVFWFVAVVIVVIRGAAVVSRVAVLVSRYGPALVPAAAAAWLKWRGFWWNAHLFNHGASMFNIARAVAFGQRFTYLHRGICKVGYYLASINLFVASNPRNGFLFTAFNPDPGYIRSLMRNPC